MSPRGVGSRAISGRKTWSLTNGNGAHVADAAETKFIILIINELIRRVTLDATAIRAGLSGEQGHNSTSLTLGRAEIKGQTAPLSPLGKLL
jgi:hypothetical protein